MTALGVAHLPAGFLQRITRRVAGESSVSGIAKLIGIVMLLPLFGVARGIAAICADLAEIPPPVQAALKRKTAFGVAYSDLAGDRYVLTAAQPPGRISVEMSLRVRDSEGIEDHDVRFSADLLQVQQIADIVAAGRADVSCAEAASPPGSAPVGGGRGVQPPGQLGDG